MKKKNLGNLTNVSAKKEPLLDSVYGKCAVFLTFDAHALAAVL